MLKKVVNSLFSFAGYKITRIGREQERLLAGFTQEGALLRAAKMGVNINSVIDVGASDGRWSRVCRKYFPNAGYMLIEAQKEHEDGLKEFCGNTHKSLYVISAAGDIDGELNFDSTALFGGLASQKPFQDNNRVVKSYRIDTLIEKFRISSPYFIKLDTHGFEIPILEGASSTLENTIMLLIEAYNFKVAENSLRFYELCSYLDTKGFFPVDLADLTRRKKDNCFWQMDILFLRKENIVFLSNSYD